MFKTKCDSMSQELINLNPDLKRLQDEGYEIEVSGGYLLIHQIPYLNNSKELKFGVLVCTLTPIGDKQFKYDGNHPIFFKGDNPFHKDGSVIAGNLYNQLLSEGVSVNYQFSFKLEGGYSDYHHKVTTYINLFSGPAKSLYKGVNEKTYKVLNDNDPGSVFQYFDSNSSRACINMISGKLKNQKIAIIGLGGTGSYILDLVAKTPVQEIHIYDEDTFLNHNAFRAPGAASKEILGKTKKVNYFHEMYSKMHKNIFPHDYKITSDNVCELNSMNYVFISVDDDTAKNNFIPHLLAEKITFIDVGLGVEAINDSLIGTLRVTTATPIKNDHIAARIPNAREGDNEYDTNIQIAELNALNATLAVIKWKKMSGFYHDAEHEHHNTYIINESQLINKDHTT